MRAWLRLFHRLIPRTLAGEPLRTALTVWAVALGVGVVIAIELAGTAATGSFRSSLDTLAGGNGLEVSAIGGVREEVLGDLVSLPFPLRVSPVVEGFAVVAETGATVKLAGLDLVHQELELGGLDREQAFEALRDNSSIWAGAGLGFRRGDRIRLIVNDHSAEYVVRGVLKGTEAGYDRWLVMDIGAAQAALGKTGRLDRIEIGLEPGASTQEAMKVVRAALPKGVEVRQKGARAEENRKMLFAFRWNLRVLSYIALIVGAFLIYNTIAVSVVRRRPEIGVLRALGATRGQVVAVFLGEAALFGIAGGALGLAAGRVMAEGAVGVLGATVEALYVSSRPAPIALSAEIVVMALLIGVAVALVSALAPALEASRVMPVEAMSRGRRDYSARLDARRDFFAGVLLAVAGAAATRLPPVWGLPLFGYLAALMLIGASALAIPAMVTVLSRLWRVALGRLLGVEAMLAARSLAASLSRTAVLIGALSTAVAMMASVGIMVGSFRETVSLWLDSQLPADLYLRPTGAGGANKHPVMAPELADRIERIPGVAAVDRFRIYDISYQGRPALLGGGQTEWVLHYGRTSFLPGQNREAILRELPRGDYVIVSEPFANKHQVRAGDELWLALGGREKAFEVLGVYRDFSNERGYILMDRGVLLRYLPDPAASSLAIFAEERVEIGPLRSEVERVCAGHDVVVYTNRGLRAAAMKIFDRTFAITYALEAVAIAVAIMGIAGALLALAIDRRREMGVLRVLGAAKGQVRRLILFEAGLLGLLANTVGLALGLALSLILIFVINKQSFGWTIEFHLPVALLLAGLTGIYAATVIAGLYPARVATRLNLVEAVHEE